MNENRMDLAIHDILANTTAREEYNRASFDYLLAQGDAAVPYVVSGIEEYEPRMGTGDSYNVNLFFGLRIAVLLLAELNTDLSRTTLLKLLNTDWSRHDLYSPIIEALARCGDASVVPGLTQAASGPCVRYRSENLVELYLLARKLGGHIPVSADQAVKIASDLPFKEEALQIIDDFAKEIPTWPGGRRCAFYWFYGIRVESVRGTPQALPYYAASLLANPEGAAWSKFPGVERSPRQAAKLARAHPLPADDAPTDRVSARTPDKWWQFWK